MFEDNDGFLRWGIIRKDKDYHAAVKQLSRGIKRLEYMSSYPHLAENYRPQNAESFEQWFERNKEKGSGTYKDETGSIIKTELITADNESNFDFIYNQDYFPDHLYQDLSKPDTIESEFRKLYEDHCMIFPVSPTVDFPHPLVIDFLERKPILKGLVSDNLNTHKLLFGKNIKINSGNLRQTINSKSSSPKRRLPRQPKNLKTIIKNAFSEVHQLYEILKKKEYKKSTWKKIALQEFDIRSAKYIKKHFLENDSLYDLQENQKQRFIPKLLQMIIQDRTGEKVSREKIQGIVKKIKGTTKLSTKK
ncbi:hypothetical protein ACFL43_01695 [Thermodesulfobacteriota bacterium]